MINSTTTSAEYNVKRYCSKCKIEPGSHYTHQHEDYMLLYKEE